MKHGDLPYSRVCLPGGVYHPMFGKFSRENGPSYGYMTLANWKSLCLIGKSSSLSSINGPWHLLLCWIAKGYHQVMAMLVWKMVIHQSIAVNQTWDGSKPLKYQHFGGCSLSVSKTRVLLWTTGEAMDFEQRFPDDNWGHLFQSRRPSFRLDAGRAIGGDEWRGFSASWWDNFRSALDYHMVN